MFSSQVILFITSLAIQSKCAEDIENWIWQCENWKITHMWRRWGTPENFCLVFIDEHEKQLLIKKLFIKKVGK